MADGENRLVKVEGVLEHKLIHCSAGRVSFAALGDWIFAISLRVYIEAAAGEQDPVHPGQQFGYAILPLVQRHDNRDCASGVQGGEIWGQRALIVG